MRRAGGEGPMTAAPRTIHEMYTQSVYSPCLRAVPPWSDRFRRVPAGPRAGHSGSTHVWSLRSDRHMATPCDLRFDCGRICLDLAATTGGAPAERLTGPDQLRAWLVGAGLVPRGTPLDGLDAGWVGRFRALRELVRRLVHDELRGRGVRCRSGAAQLRGRVRPAARPARGTHRRRHPGPRPPRPARLRRAAGRGGPGRGRAADRRGGPRAAAPVRGRELHPGVSGHIARPAPPLVLQRGVRQPGAGGAAPAGARRCAGRRTEALVRAPCPARKNFLPNSE